MGTTSCAVAPVWGNKARKTIGMSLGKAARQPPIKVSQHRSGCAFAPPPSKWAEGNQGIEMYQKDAVIVGYAETKIVDKSDRDIWELSAEILEKVIIQTGIEKDEIDGLVLSSSMTAAGSVPPGPRRRPGRPDRLFAIGRGFRPEPQGGELAAQQVAVGAAVIRDQDGPALRHRSGWGGVHGYKT